MAAEFHYRNIACSKMSEQDVASCARLFSENYGRWSPAAGETRAGRPIRLSPSRIRQMFCSKSDRYVALMFDDAGHLIGQVFYVRRASPWSPQKRITFILQLVLANEFRGHRLGLKLLQSILGLSSDDAWGLFTSNPLTIRALEDATFRHVDVPFLARRMDGLKTALSDVFDGTAWLDSFREGRVDTHFPVDHSQNEGKIKRAYPEGGFPFRDAPLAEGEEWLAVVFNSQSVDIQAASLQMLTSTSWEVLRDAYSRMDVSRQGWARHAQAEVDFLLERGFVKKGDSVLDLGCGVGRHAVALAKRGVAVHGVDFSKTLLARAEQETAGYSNLSFERCDILDFKPKRKYDVVLCLYDVIGSSVHAEDNARIVRVIRESLRAGGVAIVSVMNLEAIKDGCRLEGNTYDDMSKPADFKKLVDLPQSTTMQDSGEVFNGKLLLANFETGIVYHKEQFVSESALPAEYVVADKRFSSPELAELFAGFETLLLSHVRAGKFEQDLPSTDSHAKEIVGVFRSISGWSAHDAAERLVEAAAESF